MIFIIGKNFNPPTPCGVGPPTRRTFSTWPLISIHPPRAGWDQKPGAMGCSGGYFNPPTPCGVGPESDADGECPIAFQSTHPVRGGTPSRPAAYQANPISIHPPRAGWDAASNARRPPHGYFNPPTPCGVGQLWICAKEQGFYFNPPTPCGVGRIGVQIGQYRRPISIHPPRAGWDVRRWTACEKPQNISIHPPRAGWDEWQQIGAFKKVYFNPPTPCGVGRGHPAPLGRSYHFNPPTPCGVGRCSPCDHLECKIFQSTHPVRGGTSRD